MNTETSTTAIVLPKKAKKSVVIAALVERARIKHQEEHATSLAFAATIGKQGNSLSRHT